MAIGRQFSCLSKAAEEMAQAFGIILLLALARLIGTLCCSFDAQSQWLLLTSHLACLLSVPNLALILLLDPESRASNKRKYRIPKNLLGTLLITLQDLLNLRCFFSVGTLNMRTKKIQPKNLLISN